MATVEPWMMVACLSDAIWENLIYTVQHGQSRVAGCGEELEGVELLGDWVVNDEIGEGATDINADAQGGVCSSLGYYSMEKSLKSKVERRKAEGEGRIVKCGIEKDDYSG